MSDPSTTIPRHPVPAPAAPWRVALASVLLLLSAAPRADTYPVQVRFSATGFTPDSPGVAVPSTAVSGSFSFMLDDSGLQGVGVETRDFPPRSASRFEIDAMVYDGSNTSIQVTWIDGELAEILFASPADAPSVNPTAGTDAFALLLLGPPQPSDFGFEQMRYTSSGVEGVTFETTTGTAEVTVP